MDGKKQGVILNIKPYGSLPSSSPPPFIGRGRVGRNFAYDLHELASPLVTVEVVLAGLLEAAVVGASRSLE